MACRACRSPKAAGKLSRSPSSIRAAARKPKPAGAIWSQSLIDRSANAAWVTKEVVDAYARPIVRDVSRSTALLRRLGNARESEPIEDRARTIDVPVLLLLGDVMHPSRPGDDEVARMRASLRSFRVDTIANAGHYLQEEQPAQVVERVLRVAAGEVSAPGRSPNQSPR